MRTTLLAALAVTAGFAVTGCSMNASHALMGTGLVVATGGAVAPGEYRELSAPTVSIGLAMFAVGWILQQSDDPRSTATPLQRIYASTEAPAPARAGEKLGIYRSLPAVHGRFTR